MYQQKTWKDRISEFPSRRMLTGDGGTTETVTVLRDEGNVSVEGDEWNAANMNDLEERINQAFTESLDVTLPAGSWVQNGATFSQRVVNSRFTEESEPVMYSLINGLTAAQQQAYIKAYTFVSCGYAITDNGGCTFYAYTKPTTTITVRLKGV